MSQVNPDLKSVETLENIEPVPELILREEPPTKNKRKFSAYIAGNGEDETGNGHDPDNSQEREPPLKRKKLQDQTKRYHAGIEDVLKSFRLKHNKNARICKSLRDALFSWELNIPETGPEEVTDSENEDSGDDYYDKHWKYCLTTEEENTAHKLVDATNM